MIVMVYKVAWNPELSITEPSLFVGELQGSFEPLVTTLLSADQFIILCVFVFRDTLFNMYCWCIKIELTASSTIALAWMITHI